MRVASFEGEILFLSLSLSLRLAAAGGPCERALDMGPACARSLSAAPAAAARKRRPPLRRWKGAGRPSPPEAAPGGRRGRPTPCGLVHRRSIPMAHSGSGSHLPRRLRLRSAAAPQFPAACQAGPALQAANNPSHPCQCSAPGGWPRPRLGCRQCNESWRGGAGSLDGHPSFHHQRFPRSSTSSSPCPYPPPPTFPSSRTPPTRFITPQLPRRAGPPIRLARPGPGPARKDQQQV
jgi:hypothetical protein